MVSRIHSSRFLHLNSNRVSPCRSGFTLIEILLALAIAAIVITIVNMAFFSSHRLSQSVKAETQTYQMVRVAFATMIKDLTSAYVPLKMTEDEVDMYRFVGMNNDEYGINKDSLYFTTASETTFDPLKGGICEVDYYLEEMEGSSDLYYLMRRDDCTPHYGITSKGNAFELAEDITGMNIVYLDKDLNEFDNWDLKDMGYLPREVKITISFKQGDKELEFTGVAFLPLTWIKPEIITESKGTGG